MKLSIAFASIAALAILAPAAGFAADPLPVGKTQPADAPVSTSHSNKVPTNDINVGKTTGATANPQPADTSVVQTMGWPGKK